MSIIDDRIFSYGIVPVVVARTADEGAAIAGALADGGLPVAEVTFRTPAAADAIARVAERGDILLGAGTVTTTAQVDRAVAAGAQYIVSPGTSRAVVERALEHGVPVIPGAVTATEVQAALELGLTTVKFFPAQTSGGAAAIRALAAPFGDVTFLPTGGIGPANLADYLGIAQVAAVGGSWMLPASAVEARAWGEISAATADAVAAVQSLRGLD
ncbi:2-dehydro-3-deoxyphosphogluconate aldolase/(4S)-4-hydroxy-2-oxoglutarate aldolase [Microbacterium terrae]|uniref:2-dehydro-3-deoxy-phosphogluconate aldolase n=1 Tax=Microbacterium terrae TaxID=69369 RepID=A0A0M2H771_9MICO|nr:bifunctional 4-hydroxy-2-oxoglutarate aldolase/2-dehydro-3-deoxy-phosphogluconate aldolase [Microbacterium terrae]KJL39928.1 putative KHG/KDPG aldolase [Microbacterium terrae]MBP1076866.1 2-dehydro-3-deoxyphosphogluconate aldolase/(4S)-4-hydroxy-2-oxoglutarate aldolase [Microbacterium terrae]GLJ99461.1 2-dehydro-3-deoxy-phosphogluconate aldolase [Microbacterium terrae]